MNVVLIGYRASGKTSVGRLLADRLGTEFVDTDEIIAHQAGCSIAEIFATEGEEGFRARERAVIGSAVARPGKVISVGGGAVESADNRKRLRDYGKVIWLQAPADVLWRWMQEDADTAKNRPNLTQGGLAEVEEVQARREPLYAETAHVVIQVADLSFEQAAEAVVTRLSED